MFWGFFGYLRVYHKPYIYTALPKKQAKTKQGADKAVSTSKLVISVRLPTLTQLCFSCTRNLLKHSSLILLCFISLGHESYFEEKEQGDFRVHHRYYSPIYKGVSITQEQSHGAMGGQFPNLQSHSRQPRALAVDALWQEQPQIREGSAKLQASSTPKKKPPRSNVSRKAVVFNQQTPTISPKLIMLTF